MDDLRWPGDWLRGVLELCVLAAVAEGPTYGYAISRRLEKAGIGAVRGGTLYPLLTRLEGDGFVESSWRAGEGGPGRKYFEVTEAGRVELANRSSQWGRFVQAIQEMVGPGSKEEQ